MNYKILDLIILAFVAVFFVGVLAFEHDIFGLQQPIIHMNMEWKQFFDVLIYPIVVLLVADLILKYRKLNEPRQFVKKYWIDIVMLALIPVFSIFKVLKISLSMIKKLKTLKMGAKVIHKTTKQQ